MKLVHARYDAMRAGAIPFLLLHPALASYLDFDEYARDVANGQVCSSHGQGKGVRRVARSGSLHRPASPLAHPDHVLLLLHLLVVWCILLSFADWLG